VLIHNVFLNIVYKHYIKNMSTLRSKVLSFKADNSGVLQRKIMMATRVSLRWKVIRIDKNSPNQNIPLKFKKYGKI